MTSATVDQTQAAALEDVIRRKYSEQAKHSEVRTEAELKTAIELAQGFGYTPDDLKQIPPEALLGLQCGNPILDAQLQHGETVVDLGSGAGVDVFLAAARVGPTGRAIGVDFSSDMCDRAQRTAQERHITNVEFRAGRIQDMPVANDTADCIVSNCVINLAPKKMDVFRDMFRVLKPGGRITVSDVVATDKPMPADLRNNVLMFVGCVSGAITVAEYRQGLAEAGFQDISIVDKKSDLNAMWNPNKNQESCVACTTSGNCGKKSEAGAGAPPELQGVDMNDYVFSATVRAIKPRE